MSFNGLKSFSTVSDGSFGLFHNENPLRSKSNRWNLIDSTSDKFHFQEESETDGLLLLIFPNFLDLLVRFTQGIFGNDPCHH